MAVPAEKMCHSCAIKRHPYMSLLQPPCLPVQVIPRSGAPHTSSCVPQPTKSWYAYPVVVSYGHISQGL